MPGVAGMKRARTDNQGSYDDGSVARRGSLSFAQSGSPNGFDCWLASCILKLIGKPSIEFVLCDGVPVSVTPGPMYARILFHDRRALFAVTRSPSMGFGDSYSAGRIEVDGDLYELMCESFRAMVRVRDGSLQRLFGLWPSVNRTKCNTLSRSKDNVFHH